MDSILAEKSFDTMADELIFFLKQIGFHPVHIQRYRHHIKRIKNFLNMQGLSSFTSNECDKFIKHIIGHGEYRNLNIRDKEAIRCANILIEYQLTGMISYRIKQKQKLLHGQIGFGIQSYLDYRKSVGISSETLQGIA